MYTSRVTKEEVKDPVQLSSTCCASSMMGRTTFPGCACSSLASRPYRVPKAEKVLAAVVVCRLLPAPSGSTTLPSMSSLSGTVEMVVVFRASSRGGASPAAAPAALASSGAYARGSNRMRSMRRRMLGSNSAPSRLLAKKLSTSGMRTYGAVSRHMSSSHSWRDSTPSNGRRFTCRMSSSDTRRCSCVPGDVREAASLACRTVSAVARG